MKTSMGAPDYSHHDYAAESLALYGRGKAEGAKDREAGFFPNEYLYKIASPDYSHAKGYSEGYGAPAQEHSAPSNNNAPERERGPYIGTYTGRFYMTDPRPDDFTLEDVAHGLANICRYTGACQRRQSVAEHSVLIVRWLRSQGASAEEQMCGLMHDAPESLSGFGDVSRPAKQLAPIIKATEESIWRLAVAPKFNLPAELPAIVHHADNRIIADEMAQNMGEVDPAYFAPLGVTLQFWTPEEAEAEFLATYWSIIETGRM